MAITREVSVQDYLFLPYISIYSRDLMTGLTPAVLGLFLIHAFLLVGRCVVQGKLQLVSSARTDGIYGRNASTPIQESSVLQLATKAKGSSSDSGAVGSRVAYGSDAAPGDFPYIGLTLISPSSGGTAQCASSKISERVAITAAHCLKSESTISIQGAYGIVSSLRFSANAMDAYEYTYYPGYNERSYENDIGLIAYPTAINAESVALSTITTEDALPSPLYTTGWGRTEAEYLNNIPGVSENLQYAAVPYVTKSDCANTYISWGLGGLPPSHICAGGVLADACVGDSGGPLAIEGARWPTGGYTSNILVGITSFGPVPCGGPLNIGAYTSVAPFVRWISDSIWLNNWEGAQIPSVLNTETSGCFDGAVIESSYRDSIGDCVAACKSNSQCGTWDYIQGGICTLHAVGGFTQVEGACAAGWLNRNDIPAGVVTEPFYYEYQGATLSMQTGAVSPGGCAQACVSTSGCKYFTYIGTIGSGNEYNPQGANCQLVDAGATPVQSSRFTGATSGSVDGNVGPVVPSSPPPPPSVFPVPSPSPPPSPPKQVECQISEGTYVIYSADRTCSARYLGHNRYKCSSKSVMMQKRISRTAARFVIESTGDTTFKMSAVKQCRTKDNKVTLSFSKPYSKSVYLSSYQVSWRAVSSNGSSCSKVALQRKGRSSDAYLTRGSKCRSSVYRSSSIQGNRQYWYLRKISDSVSQTTRKCA